MATALTRTPGRRPEWQQPALCAIPRRREVLSLWQPAEGGAAETCWGGGGEVFRGSWDRENTGSWVKGMLLMLGAPPVIKNHEKNT